MNETATKKCSKCNNDLPLSSFSPNKHVKCGVQSACKICVNKNKKRTKEDNHQEYLKYLSKRRDTLLKAKYNISYDEYLILHEKQNGTCAICNIEETTLHKGTLRLLAVDHDHITGDVRGLLCTKCNTALGLFKDNPELLENAIKYLVSSNKRCIFASQ